jgi:hypothetical protein
MYNASRSGNGVWLHNRDGGLFVIALIFSEPTSKPVTDRVLSSFPDILKQLTNGYALFGLVVLVVGIFLLLQAKNWAKIIGTLALVVGAIIVIYILNRAKAEEPIVLSGVIRDARTKCWPPTTTRV